MNRTLQTSFTTICVLCLLISLSGCKKKSDSSNIVFTQVKTTGVVETVAPDKITMKVLQDDRNFKKDDQVVVTFQNIYLSKSLSKSDVLEKTSEVRAGDIVYVIYSEEQKKGTVINGTDLVKEESNEY